MPAATAPVAWAAPAFELELVPWAAGVAADAVFASLDVADVAPIAEALEADIEETLAMEALEPIVEVAELPLMAEAPAELVTPLIAPAAVASPPKPE